MMPRTEIDRIRAVKRTYASALMNKANVIGVGIGYTWRGGEKTDQLALVVMVKKKIPGTMLSQADLIPSEIDGVPVDVQEVGEVKAQE